MLAVQHTAPFADFANFEGPLMVPPRGVRTDAVSMQLNALRQRGRIVDFVWEFASDAAAALLHCDPHTLRGRYLRDVAAAGPLGHPALIDRYRRVLEHGNSQCFEQVHFVRGRQEIVIHRVVPEGDGVLVTLTNLSANRRAQIQRLRFG
jgi:hypothetical protein